MKSWKTTVLGICTILGAVCASAVALLDGDPATTVNAEALVTTVLGALAGLGLIAARDNDKTSEDAGAK